MQLSARITREIGALLETLGSPPLRLENIEMFSGPTPWSLQPNILCTIEIENRLPLPALRQLLLEQWPQLKSHAHEFPGWDGSATAAADLTGRLAATLLAASMGMDVGSGVRPISDEQASFWIEILSAEAAIEAATTALSAVSAASAGSSEESIKPLVASLERLCARTKPAEVAVLLMEAARTRNIPFLPVGEGHALWQFGWGSRSQLFHYTNSNADSAVIWQSQNKTRSKLLFRSLSLPTPAWRGLGPQEDPARASRAIGFPCVVKPERGMQGNGVVANIRTPAELDRAIAIARSVRPTIVIERHVPGDDHRLLIAHGRLIAAVRREPPEVTGDGKRTILELIVALNAWRSGAGVDSRLRQIPIDSGVDETLAAQGLNRDSVPADGQTVQVRSNANYTSGGTATDVFEQVHPETKMLAEQLAAALGFATAGIDYLTPDISLSHEHGGHFIEINATPGIRAFGAAGLSVGEIASLVLGQHPARIPVTFLVVPEQALDPVAALLAKEIREDGGAALVNRAQAQIAANRLPSVGLGIKETVEAVLRYTSVTSLHILWTAEDVQDLGLPVDQIDRTILLGDLLPAEWSGLLRSISGEVVVVERPEEAVRRAVMQLQGPVRKTKKRVAPGVRN